MGTLPLRLSAPLDSCSSIAIGQRLQTIHFRQIYDTRAASTRNLDILAGFQLRLGEYLVLRSGLGGCSGRRVIFMVPVSQARNKRVAKMARKYMEQDCHRCLVSGKIGDLGERLAILGSSGFIYLGRDC